MPIHYLTGDATQPQGEGMKVIVHCCNTVGAWGAGFVLALSRRYSEPEITYRKSFSKSFPPELGDVQFITVSHDVIVANLIGQRGLRGYGNETPIKYEAIRAGLTKVASFAESFNASVHMPRMGCGLAGGSWDKVEPILKDSLRGLRVYVYDLPR